MNAPARSFIPVVVLTALSIGGSVGSAADDAVSFVTHEQLLTRIQSSQAAVKIVNFWATWCMPCREEFPDFVRVGREMAKDGIEVVFVSADFADAAPKVRQFLDKHGVSGPAYIKVGKDQPFINAISDQWSGALPATGLYDSSGRLRDFWEGKVQHDELTRRIRRLLDKQKTPPKETEQ